LGTYLIGYAARLAGVSAETARGYCRRGLLSPSRDSSGRRLFSDRDVQTMKKIYAANMGRRMSAQPEPESRTVAG